MFSTTTRNCLPNLQDTGRRVGQIPKCNLRLFFRITHPSRSLERLVLSVSLHRFNAPLRFVMIDDSQLCSVTGAEEVPRIGPVVAIDR